MKFKKYDNVYKFCVKDAVLAGHPICVVDKKELDSYLVAKENYIAVVNMLEDNTGRYEFFTTEEFED